jgi:16S rRNA (cytosine967-C5)-methyltransferase
VSASPARRAALRVLSRVRTRSAWASDTLDSVLSRQGLTSQDVALATRLTYGTLQTVGVLDEAIDRLARRPADIEPNVRDALRLGAYELLFARTPPRAVVNETVEAVKSLRPQAASLANALLRRLAAEVASFPWGDPATDVAAYARGAGHPVWLVELLVRDLGAERADAVLTGANEPAPLYLWHSPFAGSLDDSLAALEADGAEPTPCDPPGCLVAGVPSAAVHGSAIADGRVLVADAAAQVAARAIAPQAGMSIVELAAGRGTKTVELQGLARAAGGVARIWAVELHAFKTRVLGERLAALGIEGVTVLQGDATDVAAVDGLPSAATADAVLLDAPCTGTGTLRRHPEKRWRLAEADLSALAAVQRTLLEQAATLVRPGGVVVYSTCSLARRENHDVVSDFLAGSQGAAFRTRSVADAVPEAWHDAIGPEGWFQSIPRLAGPDGHFVAALERMG